MTQCRYNVLSQFSAQKPIINTTPKANQTTKTKGTKESTDKSDSSPPMKTLKNFFPLIKDIYPVGRYYLCYMLRIVCRVHDNVICLDGVVVIR